MNEHHSAIRLTGITSVDLSSRRNFWDVHAYCNDSDRCAAVPLACIIGLVAINCNCEGIASIGKSSEFPDMSEAIRNGLQPVAW
ncbi:hypothetical protein [Paraburkholderia piptadeniae]|uniref:hypothetical protein n=1 Tax=Paraburkholderia piptadeniae TaxID=1701573 RepID=UPI00117F6758|nr:hypothetical protein [Paraburkholderia piptadeniae]